MNGALAKRGARISPMAVSPAVLHLVASEPDVVAGHIEACAELLEVEMIDGMERWRRRAILYAASATCVAVSAVLAGVAFMLWGSGVASGTTACWGLALTPVAPVLLAG